MKLSINNKNERVRSYDAIAVPCSCSSAYSRGSTRRHGWFDQEPPMKRRARSWCLLARSLFFFPVERRDRRSICPDSRALARRITVVTHWIPRVSSNKGISDRSIDVTQVAARAVTGGQVVTGFACYYLLASASQQHKAEGTRPKRAASPRPASFPVSASSNLLLLSTVSSINNGKAPCHCAHGGETFPRKSQVRTGLVSPAGAMCKIQCKRTVVTSEHWSCDVLFIQYKTTVRSHHGILPWPGISPIGSLLPYPQCTMHHITPWCPVPISPPIQNGCTICACLIA
jgi:hypothetical protein